jgi:hypothetical protein
MIIVFSIQSSGTRITGRRLAGLRGELGDE